MGLLVVNVVWQVFSRYVLDSPSTFTDELARILLIWVSILGAAYISGKNMHVAINVLPDRLSPKNHLRLSIINKCIIIAFVLLVLVIGGGRLVYTTFVYLQLTPILQLPMALVYLVAPLSGLLIIYYKLSDIAVLMKSSPDEGISQEFEEEDFQGSI